MNGKQQLAIGASLTLGTVVLFYLYHKVTSSPSKGKSRDQSAVRKRLSKYNPRPTREDIQADNDFKGRVVEDHCVSESGIIYHDIRYQKEGEPSHVEGESKQPVTSSAEDSVTSSQPDKENVNTINTAVSRQTTARKPPVLDDEVRPMTSSGSNVTSSDSPPALVSINNVTEDGPPAEKEESVVDDAETVNEDSVNGRGHHQAENDSQLNGQAAAGNDSQLNGQVAAGNDSQLNGQAAAGNDSQLNGQAASANKAGAADGSSTIFDSVKANGFSGELVTTEKFIRNVVRAKDKYEVERKRDHSEVIQQMFNVPSRAVGKIIGKGGKSIHNICRASGARLNFPKSRDRQATTQQLFVSGTLRQVEEAVNMLVSLMPSDSLCHDLITWTPDKALSGALKAVELIENTTCIGRVLHVTSPDCVWVQVCRDLQGIDYLNMLANLTDNITDTLGRKLYDLKNALVPVQDIKEGTTCAVMVEGRGYRGTVLSPGTPENEVHQVRLVDFGTPHSFTELFSLDSCYNTMPALAVQCSLAHLDKTAEDSVWPERASELLEEILADCFVKVRTVREGNVPKVELYTQQSADNPREQYVNQELVYEGYATWTD